MRVLGLESLDLNLLVALDVLLRERHVTRAAAAIGVTQPAASAALARLRRHFGDELLHRDGGIYYLTPLAAQLGPMTDRALKEVRAVFLAKETFEPTTAVRDFTILVADYMATVLSASWSRIVSEQAPRVRLRFMDFPADVLSNLDSVVADVDAVVLPSGLVRNTSTPCTPGFADAWMVVVDQHQVPDGGMTLEVAASRPWAAATLGDTHIPAVGQLKAFGIEPNVEVTTETFGSLPFLVAGTSRLALLQARMAKLLAPVAGVVVLPCPWPVAPLSAALFWHESLRSDPAHLWLRRTFAEASRSLGPVPSFAMHE